MLSKLKMAGEVHTEFEDCGGAVKEDNVAVIFQPIGPVPEALAIYEPGSRFCNISDEVLLSAHMVHNGIVTAGDIRKIIENLPDDAPVEILHEDSGDVEIPTGASIAGCVNCQPGLQLFVRRKE